jgi:hypothetical protein
MSGASRVAVVTAGRVVVGVASIYLLFAVIGRFVESVERLDAAAPLV